MYAQLIRRVQKILRRDSPYRHADEEVRLAIELVIGREPHLRPSRRKTVLRVSNVLLRRHQ